MSVSSIYYTNTAYLYDSLNNRSSDSQSGTFFAQGSKSSSGSTALGTKNGSSSQSMVEQLSGLLRLTRYAMDEMGLQNDSRVTFSKLKAYCEEVENRFSNGVKEGLETAKVDPSTLSFTLTEEGRIKAHGSSPFNEALAQMAIDEDPTIAVTLQESLQNAGISVDSPFTFTLGENATVTATGASNAWQKLLDSNSVTFSLLSSNLASMHLDSTIDFTLKTNDDDTISVNTADAKYSDVMKAFFKEHSSLVSDFKRTEALSGIEQARKFMRLSPSEARTRLQIESIAAWWDTSAQSSSSSFGSYFKGNYSRMKGINVSV